VIRSFTSSFLINTTSLRFLNAYRAFSQTAYLTQTISRLPTSFRYVTSFFTTNIVITRSNYFFRSLLNGILINTYGSTGNLYSKIISLSFNLSSSTTRMLNLIRNIYQPISTNIILGRISSIYKIIPVSFNFNLISYRSLGFFKTATGSISINSLLTYFTSYYKSVTGSFILTDSTLRIISLNRVLGETISISSIGTRFIIITKYTTTSLAITDSFFRFMAISRAFSQGLPLTGSIARTRQITRIFSEGLMIFATGFKPPKINERFATLELTLSGSISRVNSLIRIINQSINVNASFNRTLYLIRIFFESFNFNSLILGFKQFLCSWFSGSEASCSAAGCYYCSGTCQATTCPSPPGGGGGGWVPPPTNVTEVKAVLDTSIHIETPEVNPGDKVYAIITILKVEGPKGVVNVNLSYWIKDSLGKVLATKKTVVGIETVRSDIYYLILPSDATAGTYTFEALAQYDNATDYSFDNFQVTTEIVKPSIAIKRVDVPFILVNENTTIKVILENQENRKIDFNITLILPYGFNPQNTTKSHSLGPLSEDVIEFTFISQKAGSFSGFIKIEYDDKKVVKDFGIEVYAPEKFFIFLINYWWLIALILIALLALFIYKKRERFKREKIKYVFKRKDLLPKF
jgi:hypothetical protein